MASNNYIPITLEYILHRGHREGEASVWIRDQHLFSFNIYSEAITQTAFKKSAEFDPTSFITAVLDDIWEREAAE